MNIKKIGMVLTCFMVFFGLYFIYGYIQYGKLNKNKEQKENLFYGTKRISLFVTYKAPKMMFGSGHKKMYLFSNKCFLLGVCTFGEFPFEIRNIDTKNRVIVLVLKKAYDTNNDYIELWTKKNKRIGFYKIEYEFEQ